MIEQNDLFDYGLKIYQNSDYFKFSIDSILLAEFVRFKRNVSILDIATGNAPIPLILSTKGDSINIDAVEIQKEIYNLAQKSVAYNNLQSRIKVYLSDIRTFNIEKKYDIVTCNPPYFKVTDSSLKNKNTVKQIARHEIYLTLEEVITKSKFFLKENGTFYMVQRTERFIDTIELLRENKLGIRTIEFIYTKNSSPAEFFLIEATKNKKDDVKVKSIDIRNYKSYKDIFKEVD